MEASRITELSRRARRYPDKEAFILPRAADKNVLDIGCIDYDIEDDNDSWLHGRICRIARRTVGVDIQRDEIERLNGRGYDIVYANAESIDLKESFDLIVAGDVIEHLSNPGLFLGRVNEHLNEDGVCIITTPVSANLMRLFELLFQGYVWAHPEHTAWFSEGVLGELTKRSGLRLVEIAFIDDAHLYYKWSSWWFWPRLIDAPLCKMCPRFCESFGAVLTKSKQPS